MTVDPDAFEFPSMLTEIYLKQYKDERGKLAVVKNDPKLTQNLLDAGTRALSVLKSERSYERDSKMSELLIGLCPVAIEAGKLELAESLGRELILFFGNNVSDPDFQTGTHVGNVTLGRVELARGNSEKAAEYLLISMRAPLRRDSGYFNDFDLELAKQLYQKGEKKAVADYLKLCLQLSSFKTDAAVHQKKVSSINAWIGLIAKGIEPSFDLTKP